MAMSVDGGRGGSGSGLQSPSSTPAPDALWRRLQNNVSNVRQQIANYHPAPSYNPPVQSNSQGNYSRPMNVPSDFSPGPIQQIKPPPPSLEDFLGGDSSYQNQLRQFAQSLSDFTGDVTRRRGTLESDYHTSQKAMEDQKVKDLQNLEADYGARGMLRSGLYGGAVNDYNTEFGNRMTDLTNRETQALGDLTQQEGQFKSKQQLDSQAAREAAIRRRAEQYGI